MATIRMIRWAAAMLVGLAALQGCALFERGFPEVPSLPPVHRLGPITVVREPGRVLGQLEDGRRIPLIDLQSPLQLEPFPRLRCPDAIGSPLCVFPPTVPVFVDRHPSSVDLREDQTPLRGQGWRDTCQAFAVIAAIEAAYKWHHGLALTLSPQYLNHIDKMWLPLGNALPGNEDDAGAIGGRNPDELLALLLHGYAVPPEPALPYIPAGDYQMANAGDDPDLMDWARTYTQRAVDDFNLGAEPTTYRIPERIVATSLPQQALEGARYGPTKVNSPSVSSLHDVQWYKDELVARREPIVAYDLGDGAAHVVLLVGYDDAQ
jgi:hypothetical protein